MGLSIVGFQLTISGDSEVPMSCTLHDVQHRVNGHRAVRIESWSVSGSERPTAFVILAFGLDLLVAF